MVVAIGGFGCVVTVDDRAMAICGADAAERRNSAADCRRLFIVML